MLRGLIDGRRQPQQLVLRGARNRHQGAQGRLALGQRPSFVEHDGIYTRRRFQGRGVLEQHADLGAPAHPHGDGSGGRQRQRVRAGDHDGRDGGGQREDDALAAQQPPDQEGEQPGAQRHEHQVFACRVGQLLGRGLAGLGVLDHLHDAGQRGIGAHCRRPEVKGPGLIDGAARDPRAGLFGDWYGFAGDHALVDVTAAGDDLTVHRHPVTGPDGQLVTDDDLLQRQLLFLPTPDHAGGGGRQFQQRLHRPARGEARAHFQPVSGQREGGEHARCFKKNVPAQNQCGRHRVQVRHQNAGGDQRHHVGLTRPQRPPGGGEKRPAAPPDHRGREDQPEPGH